MGSLTYLGTNVNSLIEQGSSPRWPIGDTVRCTREWKGKRTVCYANQPGKGAFATIARGGISVLMKVEDSVVEPLGDGFDRLLVNYTFPSVADGANPEDVGLELPPDECDVTRDKLDLPIYKSPRYDGVLTTAEQQIAKSYSQASSEEVRDDLWALAHEVGSSLLIELMTKIDSGVTSFPIFPPVYRWVTTSWDEPLSDGGGYIEEPWGPKTPPAGWSWLRVADQDSFNGTYHRKELKWIGALDWDSDLYPTP